jgi:hypothetical protein
MPASSIAKPDSGKIDIDWLVRTSGAPRECATIGVVSWQECYCLRSVAIEWNKIHYQGT